MSPTKVVLSPNPVKTAERMDKNGNIIDKKTGQIIQAKEPDFVPPAALPAQPAPVEPVQAPVQAPPPSPQAVQPPTAPPSIQSGPLDIVEQIQKAKDNLKKLDELRKLKIKELKKQAELLELEK